MLPVRPELMLVFQAPLLDKACRARREMTFQYVTRGDTHEGLVPLILGVKVRRIMVVEVHPHVYPEKIRHDRHAVRLARRRGHARLGHRPCADREEG